MTNNYEPKKDKEQILKEKDIIWRGYARGLYLAKENDKGKEIRVKKNLDGFIHVRTGGVTYKGVSVKYYENGITLRVYAINKETVEELGIGRTARCLIFIPHAQIEFIISLEMDLDKNTPDDFDCIPRNSLSE